jgi:predicted homoserine dehydrogenase-like protein
LKAGEKENRCTVCRAVIDTVVVDAFGHEFDIADGAVVNAITYANGFDKNGVAFTKCARCDETSEGEVAPIFEAKGYALNSDRTGLNGGYKINTEMLLAYETINGSLNFGIVIANANSFGGAKFFNDENTVNSEKSIVAEAKERGFSSFDCSINGFGAHAGTLELVITMYVIDADGNVTYVQAVNDYANAVGTDKIADGIFTSVTLDLVRANIPEVASSYALLPSNDEE